MNDCWNSIGVRGDGSCAELVTYLHCRNCPVYATSAAELLDAAPPAAYLTDWTSQLAQPTRTADVDIRSVVMFRVGSEWLALPTAAVAEVANMLPIHSLPHRRDGTVLGLASVRGELLVCVSLGAVVGVKPAAAGALPPTAQRLLVIRREDVRAVCPVDEVHGVHRFHAGQLRNVPTTVAKGPVTYSTALLPWRDQTVAVLDEQLLFYSLKRSLG